MAKQDFRSQPGDRYRCLLKNRNTLLESSLQRHGLPYLSGFALIAQFFSLIKRGQRIEHRLQAPFHRQVKLMER